MSSTTWTTREVDSNSAALRHALWRAVEAQHVVSTMALVDSIEEQHVLERLLEETKPSIPAPAAHLHWLLFTPFRYPPPPGGSRFRGPNDPGVFYGADEIRTACAELGYWRWRHLMDSPALATMPTKPQTVFRVKIDGNAVDLRAKPFVRDRRALDRRGRLFEMPGIRPHGARGAHRRDPLRVGSRSAACGVLRRDGTLRVCFSKSARAADVDAVGRPRPCHLAAHACAPSRRARIRSPRHGRRPHARDARSTSRRGARCRRSRRRAHPARRTRSGSPSIRRCTRSASQEGASTSCAKTASRRSRSTVADRSLITGRVSSSSISFSICEGESSECGRWCGPSKPR